MTRKQGTLLAMLALPLIAAPFAAQAGDLAGAYTDPAYLTKLWFGAHSHWDQPWRAYLETVPAAQYLNAVGMGLNLDRENPDLVLQMLAKNGVRCGRIEIGWASIEWNDETKLNWSQDKYRALFAACKKWGVRPVILLNAHQGAPCPVKFFDRAVTADVAAGATQVTLDDVGDLVLGRSGLSNLNDYWAAEGLILKIEGHTVTLSKPVPKAIKAGTKVPMATLKYRPFSQPGSDDYKETIAGWQRYVGTVAAFATECLGTAGAADRGFDMEIWNELTFGDWFLYINSYYKPELVKYDGNGIWANLVKETAAYVDAHPQDFVGVRVSDGFSNTIPWTASSQEPARITAIGKHPYAGRKTFPKDEYQGTNLNALGKEDKYVPAYTESFPEYYGTALQTETLMRDAGPITTDIYGTKHGRYTRPGNPCTMWITEVGWAPNEDGINDPALGLAIKAKTTARYLAFLLNKGVDKLTLFSAAGGDLWLGQVRDDFLDYARKNATYPADDAAFTSPSLRVMGRMSAQMRPGLDATLPGTRALTVDGISDTHDHFQFAGDGTPEHPPLYDREVFAFLPYQVNARKFVIAYYVMTRDVKQALAPEEFTVTVSGFNATGAKFTAYDPINDKAVPVKVKGGAGGKVVLTLTAADYPYLLTVEEPRAAAVVSPVAGATFTQGETVRLAAIAADRDAAIARVEFLVDGMEVGQVTSSPYVLEWKNAAPGERKVSAVAYTAKGGAIKAGAVGVTITSPPAAPH